MCVPHPVAHCGALRGAKGADQSAHQPARVIDMDSYVRVDWT